MSEETPQAWPIIKECLDGNLSLRITIEALEARGVAPPGADRRYRDGRQPRWSASAVRRIIRQHGEESRPVCADCRLWKSRYEAVLKQLGNLMEELDQCQEEAARPIMVLEAELAKCREHVQRLKDDLDHEQSFH